MKTFRELGLSKPLTCALSSFDYKLPTEIQHETIPLILCGRDVMASAQTGSGKTAAFALPIIDLLGSSQRKPRALILVPTRELAVQVADQFRRFGRHSNLQVATIYGGTGYHGQTKALRRGVDVLVATPGRLSDHLKQGNVDLAFVEILVLDEADRMLDMGFMPQVRSIVARIPRKRQTLLFSATINKTIALSAADLLKNPASIRVNSDQIEPSEIEQQVFHVEESAKEALLIQLIQESSMGSVLVFTRTRRKASKIKTRLRLSNVFAEELHGNISQGQRERTLKRYREGKFSILVATDIAARGLDIPAISHVVNYDLPASPADYVHRIGRTGRAGRAGVALSFVSREQRHLIRGIEKVTGRELGGKGERKSSERSEDGRIADSPTHRRKSRSSSRRFRSSRQPAG